MTDKLVIIAPGDKSAWMFQCGDASDSYCCSPDGSPCSCETGNITLAASLSDVSSIGIISSAVSTTASDTYIVPSFATTSTYPRTYYLRRY